MQLSDQLEYRKWPYWEEAMYYFWYTHHDSLAEFMGKDWVQESRESTAQDAMIEELWLLIHEKRGQLMREGEDSAAKMLDCTLFGVYFVFLGRGLVVVSETHTEKWHSATLWK
jgi:hypothetical protein